MKVIREENARNMDKMFPVIITKLDIQSPEAITHEVLTLFKTNVVYKAYKDDSEYYVFPIRNEGTAFMFPKLEEDNAHYVSEIVVLTLDNFHSYIDNLTDDDIAYFEELLDKPINKEINERAIDEHTQALDKKFEKDVIKKVEEVQVEESTALFNVLNEKDPKLARALYEFGKYITVVVQTTDGIDKTLLDVLNDKTLGKGAYTAKTMECILRYAQSNEPEMFNNVLRAGLYSLIEMKRNL